MHQDSIHGGSRDIKIDRSGFLMDEGKKNHKSENEERGAVLLMEEDGPCLESGGMKLKGDFRRMLRRLSQSNLNGELLVKAARIKDAGEPLTAVDATAGLGEDSMLLSAAGFKVRMFERDPVIASLLKDAIRRALLDEDLREYAERMIFTEGDSIEALGKLSYAPHVVFLDPMFPERRKSGMIRKKLQLIQRLEGPCGDGEALLSAAISANPLKIVIKRPSKGPYLAGIKPDYSLCGKTVRYDVITHFGKTANR